MNSFGIAAYKVLLAFALLSGVYFSGLVLGLGDMLILIFAILGSGAVFLIPILKNSPAEFSCLRKFSNPEVYIACSSILVLSLATFLFSNKWGSWDAVLIWNLMAQALSDSNNWRKVFQYTKFSHTDYPVFLPSVNAFFLRFLPSAFSFAVPVFIAALSTILIPIWIFIRLAPNHIGVGIGALLLFLTNVYYLQIGMMQGADVWLSLWIIAAFFAYEDAIKNSRSMLYALSGFFIAMGACTKNEGILIALCFFLFLLTYLPAKRKLILVLAGALIPFIYLVLFKDFLAPDSDLFHGQKQPLLQMLTDKERYGFIWKSFGVETLSHFPVIGVGMVLYAFHCVLKARLPHRYFLFISAVLAGYFAIFLITPHGLAWHLDTATNRLLLQLFPMVVYVLGKEAIAISPIESVTEK